MSITNSTTFDHLPTEIRVNRKSYLNYNPNASTISRQKLDSMIYSTGIDDYMLNEIKKAKYQGCFDPGSIGNKNMFNDSYNYKISTTETTSNTNDVKKPHDKVKKLTRYATSTSLHRHDEGKNLLIAKSETHYPYEFDRRHCVLSKKYNFRKNINDLGYCYSSGYFSPINKIRRTLDSVKNKKLSHNSSYYFTPGYNERKYRLQTVGNKYKNKTLMIKSLMDNYNNSRKMMNYSRFNNSLNNKSSYTNLFSHKKNKCFSPIISTNRYIEYDTNTKNKYGNKIDKNIYKSLNISKEKNEDNNILFFSQLNDCDYNINSNESEFDNETLKYRLGKEIITYNDIDIHSGTENDNDNNMKLINKYMSKIVTLFLVHMSNFYLLHFRDIFNAFISQLKKSLKNDEYHFENKTIKNIALIKKKIKSNPFYYGHNKQFKNLLKEENKKNPKSENKTNIKTNRKTDISNLNEKEKEKEKINLIRKRYVLNNKKNIDKNSQKNNKNNEQKRIKVEIINKKYIKKKVSQRIIDKSRLPKIIAQQRENNKTNTELFSSGYFNENNQNEIRKLFKSFDENDIINDDKIITTANMDKKLTTSNNFTKIPNNKTKVKTLLFKKTTVPNACKINKNITLKKNKRKLNIPYNNGVKKDLHIYGVSDILSQDEKLNMNMKYLKMDNNYFSANITNNNNNKNYEIDNNFTLTILGKLKNDIDNDNDSGNNDDENENRNNTVSNKKLQNAISIITKIMESKENNYKDKDKDKDKEKDRNKINSLLKKILENKEKKNIETIQKYFNKFKDNDFRVSKKSFKKKKKFSLDLEENIDLNKSKNNLIERKLQNEDSERNRKERKSLNLNEIGTLKENPSPNRRGSKFKVVIKKLKIHKSITKNIFNPNKKINVRPSKKSIPSLTDINSTTQRSSLHKINSMIINNNILKDKDDNLANKEQAEKGQKKDKKDENSKLSIESDESSEKSNLNINNEISKKNIDTNSDKNLHRNIKIISQKLNVNDKRKSFAIPPHKRSSIEMFTKYIKNKTKLNQSNESIHDGDTTLNEKYQDYENLIFYLRTQLIYCFLGNKKNNDSCAD